MGFERWYYSMRARVRALVRWRQVEDELQEELRDHLEREMRNQMQRGLSHDLARQRAGVRFGAVEAVKERCRDLRPTRWLEDLVKDLRLALRGMSRARAFALIAVLSMAVGIGVNTALATIVEEIWLKPVPGVTGQDALVETVATEGGNEVAHWSYPDFEDVRRGDTLFSALAASAVGGGMTLTTNDRSERVDVTFVTANFFRTLGVIMARGRDFLPSADVGPGQHPVVVVSHDMWQNRLGGEENILGLTIGLNRRIYTVVGVAPEGFIGARPLSGAIDLWARMMQHPRRPGRTAY